MVASATLDIPVTQAGKGHVPEENLHRYRSLARHARQLDSLSESLVLKYQYEDGHTLGLLAQKYWGLANALRVDL